MTAELRSAWTALPLRGKKLWLLKEELACHSVCTLEAARRLAEDAGLFWVSNCGCREDGDGCSRSRMDVCLLPNKDFPPTGSGFRKVDWSHVEDILEEGREKHLVTRPFRNEDDTARIERNLLLPR
jgi:hypothetical protein